MERRRRTGGAGVSLAEGIIACFILTAAMAVSAALYHSALNHSVRIDRLHRASRAVDRKIEEIRAWSRDAHGTNGTLSFTEGWERFSAEATDPEYPEMKVSVEILDQALLSPSSAFEEVRFAAQADNTVAETAKNEKRTLMESAKMLVITGKWGEGPKDKLVTRFLLADPVKDYGWRPEEAFQAIKFASVPTTLARDATRTISAEIVDRNGRAVKNAVISWYIDPASQGKALLETHPSRSDRVVLTNVVKVDSDPDVDGYELTTHTGGWIQVVARVRLGGIEAVNKTARIELGL